MPAQILTINSQGGTKQFRRIVGGADTPFGGSFAAAADPAIDTRTFPAQRACQVGGTQTLFAFVGNFVYRSTDGGVTASPVTADLSSTAAPPVGIGGTAALPATTAARYGPFVTYVNGVPRVLVAFAASGTVVRFAYSDDLGDTWAYPQATPSQTLAIGTSNMFCWPFALWRDAIYVSSQTGAAPWSLMPVIFDPVSFTCTVTTRPSSTTAGGQSNVFVVKDDRFFGAWASSTPLVLFEFTGAWATIGTISSDSYPGTAVNNYGGIGFVHPVTGNLWIGAWSSTAPAGFRLFEITSLSPLTVVNWSASLPAGMQVASNTSRAVAWVDCLLDPDNPAIYVAFANSSIGNFTTFSVAIGNSPGVSAPVFTSIGSTQGCALPFPWYPQIGGSQSWTPGQRNILPVSRSSIPGGQRYGFKLFSPLAQPDLVRVQFLYGLATDENARNVGTLSNPSAGTIGGGPGTWYIEGLDAADPASPTIFVDWLAQADGFSPGDRPLMRMSVATAPP